MSRDFLNNPDKTKELVYRHFAWLTALRYQMRDGRAWESMSLAHNAEYQIYFCINTSNVGCDKLVLYKTRNRKRFIIN